MVSYSRQVAICESVRETIKRAVAQSDDVQIRRRATVIDKESVLRAASIQPGLDTEDKLLDFITEHVLNNLRLTPTQRERFTLNG